MLWPQLSANFLLGLASSMHCIGMCGPLLMIMPFYSATDNARSLHILSYHLMRLLAYASIGVLAGALGSGLGFWNIQQGLSISIGTLLLLGLGYVYLLKKDLPHQLAPLQWLKKNMGKLLVKPSPFSISLLGYFNGLLPCGMVYIALSTAIAAGTAQGGALQMLAFGAGTLPSMLLLSIGRKRIPLSFQHHLKRLAPILIACMALLLILRGANLGIPMLSPKFTEGPAKAVRIDCCHR